MNLTVGPSPFTERMTMRDLQDIERDINNTRRPLNVGETFAHWVQSRRGSERRLLADVPDLYKAARMLAAIKIDA